MQTAERTLIDKLFALGDYYLADKVTEHSRHIYDIYKLLNVVDLNYDLKALAVEVAAERKTHSACLSAQDGVDIAKLLREIIDKKVYKEDYEGITSALLFEPVEYDTAIKALETVLESDILILLQEKILLIFLMRLTDLYILKIVKKLSTYSFTYFL